MLALLLVALGAHAQEPALPPAPPLAIVGATVVPMDRAGSLADQTVLVADGRITALGPSDKVSVPAGATVIDGHGRWIMPGLVDMHVHSWFESELTLDLANGVTTIRNMFGSPLQVQWRDEIAAGTRLGPSIVTAGPIVDGSPPVWPGSLVVLTAEDARNAVQAHVDGHYDFVKVYDRLTPEAYDAVLAAAKAAGPFMLSVWRQSAARPPEMAEAARAGLPVREALLRALHVAGAPLLLGTDCGNAWVVAGFAVHEELANLVACGLTPAEALRAATRTPAECLRATGEFGAVAPGLRADLLLLAADPLLDVANAQKRVGLVVRGRWLPESELQARLAAVATETVAAPAAKPAGEPAGEAAEAEPAAGPR
ncbi:MAG TPA: amidohydrolase family protein [Planctomycetota bacterium]|nr:amidohydrolase family protein [Planctomycetota bacterium]